MTMRDQAFQIRDRQAGVTLLLAILILSGLTLITVTVGTFAIQELRASRAVIVTEPAIAAAESAGEQGLWAIKRDGDLSTCPAEDTQTLGNNALTTACKSFGSATVNIKGGTPYYFYLYDPDAGQGGIGDADLSGYPYSSLQVTEVTGSNSVAVSAERLDGSTTGLTPTNQTINENETANVSIAPVPAGSEGRIQVTLSSFSDATMTLDTDRGMPIFPTVDAFGCAARTTVADCNTQSEEVFGRRINITVPQ